LFRSFTTPQLTSVFNAHFSMIQLNPDVIKDCWIKTSKRSSSIKKAFGMLEHEEPETNASFMNLPITIQAFFKELIFELDCDSVKIRQRCEQLGARHVDFSERGFHSNFWDIFQVCTIEVIAECNLGLNEDQHRSYELAWIHLLSSVVKSMRNGYTRRRTHLERPKSNT
uniref:GLOBIN domain-containing protein n=1 Tax=Anisakis simplex TaxID=6269 RepID=A0A0M3JT43_ANISI